MNIYNSVWNNVTHNRCEEKREKEIIRMYAAQSPWDLYKGVSEIGQFNLMKPAQVTLKIRLLDSWPGSPIWSPVSSLSTS